MVQHAKDVAFNLSKDASNYMPGCASVFFEAHPLYNINTSDAFEHLAFPYKLKYV